MQRALIAALRGFSSAWLLALAMPAGAATYVLPPDDVDLIGRLVKLSTQYEDTLVDIARRYGVGFLDLLQANPGVDPWLPGEGTEITLPTRYILPEGPREGIVLNLPEMRLFYFPAPQAGETPRVLTFPVSVGRMDWATPLGLTRVVRKDLDPPWYPPKSIRAEHAADGDPLPRVVPPGPDNPLGRHALRLGLPGYLIHGTNKPAGIGMRVTHGCVRMFPEDVAQLFESVPVGTPVRIINEPYKMGWIADTLFLEVHPPFEDDVRFVEKGLTSITELLVSSTDRRKPVVDWGAVEKIFHQAHGIPSPMTPGAAILVAQGPKLDAWCAAHAEIDLCAAE